jgi:serine/threonine protein kinase
MPAVDPLIGTVIAGRYAIERRLGMGGMGAVYVAKQTPLGRQVALKMLRPELVADAVAVERFKREAQVIAALGHPHVVAIHDFGECEDGTLFIAMEHLVGEDLLARVQREGALPWERALLIVEQIARALAGAHGNGIVHRDLKPANVLLVDVHGVTDFVKVLDFGIAKLVRDGTQAAPSLTGAGFVPGTPGYIAPENIRGAEEDDARSDLYSLGVTWFEMLSGRLPYAATTTMKLLLQQLNDPPARLRDVCNATLPPAVEALLMRTLAREPGGRPASAAALIAEIVALRKSLNVSEALPPGAPTSESRIPVLPHLAKSPTASSMMAGSSSVPGTSNAPSSNVMSLPGPPTAGTGIVAMPNRARTWPRPAIALGAGALLIIGVVIVGLGRNNVDGSDAVDANEVPGVANDLTSDDAASTNDATNDAATNDVPNDIDASAKKNDVASSAGPGSNVAVDAGTVAAPTSGRPRNTKATTIPRAQPAAGVVDAGTNGPAESIPVIATVPATPRALSADEQWRASALDVLARCGEPRAAVVAAKVASAVDLVELRRNPIVSETLTACRTSTPK